MIAPKTNWTGEDYYNAGDLNRVEANTEYVADYFNNLGYRANLENIKTNRNIFDIDFISSINRVEDNIESIRNIFIKPPGYIDRKLWIGGKGFTFDDANRLERNLELLLGWGEKAVKSFKYCGTFSCGEDVI